MEECRRHEDRLLGETIVRLDAHETADALMFKQISGQLAEMKVSLSKLFDRFWLAAIGVIALLLAISSYLYIESAKINKEFLMQISKSVKAN